MKIDLTRSFAPVHKTEVYRHQAGLGTPIQFDVTKAWEIVDAWTPAEREARFQIRPLSLSSFEEHAVNVANAASADLSIPVLWVTVTEPNPRTGELYTWTKMIDGYTRAYKSYISKKGLKLPSFVLTAEESAACRIYDEPKKRRSK